MGDNSQLPLPQKARSGSKLCKPQQQTKTLLATSAKRALLFFPTWSPGMGTLRAMTEAFSITSCSASSVMFPVKPCRCLEIHLPQHLHDLNSTAAHDLCARAQTRLFMPSISPFTHEHESSGLVTRSETTKTAGEAPSRTRILTWA